MYYSSVCLHGATLGYVMYFTLFHIYNFNTLFIHKTQLKTTTVDPCCTMTKISYIQNNYRNTIQNSI